MSEEVKARKCSKCGVSLVLPDGTKIALGVDDFIGMTQCASCWHDYYASGRGAGKPRAESFTELEIKEQYIACLRKEADQDQQAWRECRSEIRRLTANYERLSVEYGKLFGRCIGLDVKP